MIKVKRYRIDDNENEIKPDNRWVLLSENKTKIALREKERHDALRNVYAHPKVKEALEELFFRKCTYCEFDLSRVQWEVEHFRPKGAVKERPDHLGYYWLTYMWENLYPSCVYCNQKRKARPRWGVSLPQFSGGKATQFPVEHESTRAMKPADDLNVESRLLLDPCKDNPEMHLGYDWDGQIYPFENSKKGEKSISVFNLRETRLRDKRREVSDLVCDLLKIGIKAETNNDQETVILVNEMLEKRLEDCRNFAGIARFVVDNPENFGV